MQSSEFILTANQGTADLSARLVFTGDPVVDDLPLDAFDSLGRAGLEVELVAYHPFDRHRRRDLAGVGQAADAGGEIGAQPVDVVLGDVEVDQSAVDADTDVDIETEAVVHPRTEVGDFADDVQAGQHSTMGIVFVCLRMPENSHHAVALGGADVALVAGDDPPDDVAVATDDRTVDLRFGPGRQRGRVDEVGDKHGQPPNLAAVGGGGQKVFSVGVTAVDRQHPAGKCVRGDTVAAVDGPDRTLE